MGGVCCKLEEIDFAQQEVCLNHFYVLRVIGKGAFGKVRIVQHKGTRKEYAIKCIDKRRCIALRAAPNMVSERHLLERIHHPHVVNLRYAFQDDLQLFMVLDLMLGGDLRYHLERYGPLNEHQVRFYIAEMALALGYLHRRRIAHRDIKPDNILLDEQGHAHLTDFNIATLFDERRPLRSSKAGSLAYMAPEMLNKTGYSVSVDWWSLGIVAYELLFGRRPFKGSTSESLVNAILHDPLEFPDRPVSPECIDAITQLLDRSPLDRLGSGPGGYERLKEHPWFRDIDWEILAQKKCTPPFKPSAVESNFDALHEIEDILLDDGPIPTKKPSTASGIEKERQEAELARQLMATKFTPFDYTKLNPPEPTEPITETSSMPTDNRLLRRIGGTLNDHFDHAKYRSQGYVPAAVTDVESDKTV